MNVVLYARVSSEKQADKGLSIPAQLDRLKEHCAQHGHFILQEFVDEGITGTSDQRPQFRRMIQFCKLSQEVNAILVWSFSRFSRDRVHSAVYKRVLSTHNVKVISITEHISPGIDAEVIEGFFELIDSQKPKRSAVDTMRGVAEVARQGFYPFSSAPIGYKRVQVGGGKRRRFQLMPDEDHAPLVRRIFETYLSEGTGAKELAKRLNTEGLRTPSGKLWGTNSVLRILRNHMYKGTLHTQFKTRNAQYLAEKDQSIHIENAHEPIIDPATFEKAQVLLSKRSAASPKVLGSEYLLSGLLRCAQCGATLYGKSAKSGKYHYYECARRIQSGPGACQSKAINAQKLDAIVLEKTSEVLLEPANIQLLTGQVNSELGDHDQVIEDRLKILEAEIKTRRAQVERLLDALENGAQASTLIVGRLAARKDELRLLEAERLTLRSEDAVNLIQHVDIGRVLPYVESLRETLSTSPVKTRRFILKSFIKRITVGKSQITIEYSIPQERNTESSRGGVLGMVTSGTPKRIRTRSAVKSRQWETVGS